MTAAARAFNRYCPFKDVPCNREACELWVEGCCSIKAIANELKRMSDTFEELRGTADKKHHVKNIWGFKEKG
jgi:hypothetical protein